MFRQNTTFIIGAGASCEVGLPSGDALKGQILTLLQPSRENAYGFADNTMIEIAKKVGGVNPWEHQRKLAPIRDAADRIKRGLPLALSIDNFLHSHQGDVQVESLGKLAIAICILRAEAQSYLFKKGLNVAELESGNNIKRPSVNSEALAKSWYPAFARQLMSGIHRSEISKAFASLRFIVFNYDRCLEQYIWMALQEYFDIDEDEASHVLEDVSFIHPYGDLGPLPWGSAEDSVALGSATTFELSRVAARIRTFTESVGSDLGGTVKDAVEWAETLVILGFGYLDQNIQLLSRRSDTRGTRVFSTAYGVSQPDQLVMKDAMIALGGVTANAAMIEPGSCRDLFENYRLHISLR